MEKNVMAMPVSAAPRKQFTPAPEGLHNAVLVDIVDLGMQPGFEGKMQHQCRFVWELEALRPAEEGGGRCLVFQKYGVSLADRANLRKALRSWRGADLTAEELQNFDIESMIGKPCQILVAHNTSHDGTVYANVQSILKSGPVKLKPSGDYKRRKDRDDWKAPKDSPWNAPPPAAAAAAGGDDEPDF
jgi:hypothetical protein